MLLQNVYSCILNTFAVNQSVFDDLTSMFGWWYRHNPVLPCNENYHRFDISLQANNLNSLSPYATDLTSDR
jgi:hypothetical protein